MTLTLQSCWDYKYLMQYKRKQKCPKVTPEMETIWPLEMSSALLICYLILVTISAGLGKRGK